MKDRNKTSGIVLIVAGMFLLLAYFVPNGFWNCIPRFWIPLLAFFDSLIIWRVIFCAFGVLWLIYAVRKYRYVQTGFALTLTLTNLLNLFHLDWIPFWPFAPAAALTVTGGLLLFRGTG